MAKAQSNPLRDAIFSSAKINSRKVEFFGQTVELRQPTMEFVMTMTMDENRARSSAKMIIGYCYNPETGERVFEDADLDSIMALPFGPDMTRMNKALNELTNLDVELEEGNSSETESVTSH